jgi:hypothetical protein
MMTNGQSNATAEDGVRNMLSDALKRGRILRGITPRAKEFLLTTGRGGGWSTGDNVVVPNINPTIGNYIGFNGAEYSPVTSEPIDTLGSPLPGRQFENFVEFVQWFKKTFGRQTRGNDASKIAVGNILENIALDPDSIARFNVAMGNASAQVVRTGLYEPLSPTDQVDSQRHKILLEGSCMAFIKLTMFTDLVMRQKDAWSIFNLGRARDDWARELCTHNHIIQNHFGDPLRYKKSERYRMLKDSMRLDLGFNSTFFEEVIIAKPATHYIRFPPQGYDEDYVKIFDYVREHVLRNSIRYGFALRFFYGAEEASDDLFRYYVRVSRSSKKMKLDEHALIDLIDEGRINSVFERAREDGTVIEIDHPIHLIVEEVRNRKSYPFPIRADETASIYHVDSLVWPYAFDDNDWTRLDPASFGVHRPEFAIDEDDGRPIEPFSLSTLENALVTTNRITTMRDGFEIVDDFKYVLRVRK